ncbi:MAG: DUF3782 domain-containing protein [Chloroflexi bacterium]|nr:DUF3782 domain-containing protein [Chloroflexota bacterium]
MDQRFEQVDQRFEQVDQRFEQVDQRFEQVDQRFEQVDQRLDQMDGRMGRMEGQMVQMDGRMGRMEGQMVQMDGRVGKVEERLDSLETRMEAGFVDVRREMREGFRQARLDLDRLGARWGIRNEELFRETMASVLEKSFGVRVTRRVIGGDEFDCLIFDGQHILVEITASAGPKTQKRLERKRTVYEQETGIRPARFILAVGSIASRRAQALRNAGFEVIEREEDESLED